MKTLILLLSFTTLMYGASDEILEISVETLPLQEIASLEPLTPQLPFVAQDFELPTPTIQLPRQKSVFLATALSNLFPGLGHAYLGDLQTAGAYFGTCSAGVGVVAFPGSKGTVRNTSMISLYNVWSYSVYSAYRDARNYNGQFNYQYKMPNDSLGDLASAPFNPKIIRKPEVWGGLLGSFALASVVAYFSLDSKEGCVRPALSTHSKLSPVVALPVGIGEEAFFRGFLQSELSESLTPWGGIIASSVLFGVAHMGNAIDMAPDERRRYFMVSVPYLTTAGIYLGWLTHKNHSMKESVALHTWYDFILFAGSALAQKAAVTTPTEFSLAIPF